jgi:cysteine desulfurase
MRQHCEIFSKIVLSALPNTKLNSLQSALPNTLSLTLDSLQADDLVVALDVEGILISSGAACASGKPEASHVLLALGLTPSEAKSTVRVSFTGLDSDGAVENAAKAFVSCVRRMRKEAA